MKKILPNFISIIAAIAMNVLVQWLTNNNASIIGLIILDILLCTGVNYIFRKR